MNPLIDFIHIIDIGCDMIEITGGVSPD